MTFDDFYQDMSAKLKDLIPEIELRYKAELAYEINILKEQKNAVILGHNYMEPALFHSIPDFTGDSLSLCQKAAKTDKEIIVFCGVRFMAETAKILNPDKTVLIPSQKAGCSLAEGITAEDVRWLRKQFPGVPVVSYVNTYAEIKAETDICCTSSNALKVVDSLDTETVIFIPDEYLAANVAKESGKHIIFPTLESKIKDFDNIDYQIIGWKSRCEVHEQFTVDDIKNVRQQFPDVLVLAHPECSPAVIKESDFSGSTKAMISEVQTSNAECYFLLTECSMGDNIAAENPDKEMVRLCSIRCPHMNQITLEDTLKALQKTQYVVDIPEDILKQATKSVERMIEIY